VTHELETRDACKVPDVLFGSRIKVVYAQDIGAYRNQTVAEMAPKKPCTAGHYDLLFHTIFQK
jgi:hypothetical protein